MRNWVDYYRVLQVHYDAEPDVIKNTYKKLCHKYHPDINTSPDAEDKMKQINIAYEVLSDSNRRKKYYQEWCSHNRQTAFSRMPNPRDYNGGATARKTAPKPNQQESQMLAGRKVLEHYFTSISNGMYQEAYGLISDVDKQHITNEEFSQWQKAVAKLYSIRNFTVKLSKLYTNFLLNGEKTCTAQRFTVHIAERSYKTGEDLQYDLGKFVVHENEKWRVYLGYKDLDCIIDQFNYLNIDKEKLPQNADYWQIYQQNTDISLGISNYEGFKTQLKKESYRYNRYKRSMAIAILKIKMPALSEKKLNQRIIAHISLTLRNTLRNIDFLSYVQENYFGILLSEINSRSVSKVIKRMVSLCKKEIANCFDIPIDIKYNFASYKGGDIEKILEKSLAKLKKA